MTELEPTLDSRIEQARQELRNAERKHAAFEAQKRAQWRLWVPLFGGLWFARAWRRGCYYWIPASLKTVMVVSNLTSIYMIKDLYFLLTL